MSGSVATTVPVANAQYLIEGMIIDIVKSDDGTPLTNGSGRRIKAVNRGTTRQSCSKEPPPWRQPQTIVLPNRSLTVMR